MFWLWLNVYIGRLIIVVQRFHLAGVSWWNLVDTYDRHSNIYVVSGLARCDHTHGILTPKELLWPKLNWPLCLTDCNRDMS